jgi:hypothetical protein
MPRTATRNRSAYPTTLGGYTDHFADHERSMNRHRFMFKVAAVVVALIFVATAAFMIWFFVSGQNVSYSYDYKFGGVSYHESYNLDR